MEPSRILCLRFPNWPIQAHRLRVSRDSDAHACPAAIALHTPLPDSTGAQIVSADADVLRDQALLRQLFPAARSGPAIVAVSGPAWKHGVRPGLPLAEARSLAAPLQPPQAAKGKLAAPQNQTSRSAAAPSGKQPVNAPAEQVQFVPWNAAADREELRLLSDPVRRFAPIVGLDSLPLPDSLLLNITGCGPLFGGEEQLAQELLQMLRASQLVGRVGIADSIAAAWAVAHTDSPGSPPIVVVATGASGRQLNPLPTAAARLAVSDLEILQHLGIVRIGQLLAAAGGGSSSKVVGRVRSPRPPASR
jgi:nucleotidyltransferase/DNA polymerase involved in DNA repair